MMKRLSIITGLLAAFLFGLAAPFSKMLLNGLNSFQLAGLLYLGAALAMLPFIYKKNNGIKSLFEAGSRTKTTGIIFFGGIAGPLLLLAGLKTAHASSVSIWLNMELVATAVLGVLFFKDNLNRNAWIGVALTLLAGIVTSAGEGISGIGSGLLITAACICWGIDNHLTSLTDRASPQAVTFIKGLTAGSINLITGMLISNGAIDWQIISLAITIGIFAYGFSIVLYVISAQNIGATRGQVLFSTAPVWGVILSYLLNHEPFLWEHVVSVVLLLMAVVMTNLLSHRHLHTHAPLKHVHYHTHSDEHHHHLDNGASGSESKSHSHFHTHDPITHEHTHNPDLHHRHDHDAND